ncbi:SprT-like domain-containing protein [Paenibacillus polymyxa]|uniref:SprT-like domain-containing protein n=1 Tax=Paenibacillus polymyxa TaxID=1406 RepID=UPI00111AAE83|nr:SprT-like domain-containing protein [Paenibacillus polymyxa]QDA30248.1 SprT family zinc-dependent metalloprotease [Paenibacillus polymyxa]
MIDAKSVTIKDITAELHHVFHLFNEEYFDGMLPIPAITIQSNGHRRSTMGWCSTVPVWGTEDGSVQMYELNLSAEFLRLDFYEHMDTMLHEMVHLFHKVTGVKDTSRDNAYHNKHFKNKVLELGFEYETNKPDPVHGWTYARLGKKAKEKISAMPINQDIFSIARYGYEYFKALEEGRKPAAPSQGEPIFSNEGERPLAAKARSMKWVCPSCGMAVRSYKANVNLMCMDCEELLEKQ